MKLSEVALLVGLMSGIASVDAMESNENEYISTIYVKNTKDTQTNVYNDQLRKFRKVSIDRLMDEEILNEHSIQEALTNVNTRKYMLILLDRIVYDDDENLKPLARKIFLDWNILDKVPLIDCLNDRKSAYYTLDLLNDLMLSEDKEFFILSAKILNDEKIFSKDFIKKCLNDKKTEKIMLDIMSNFASFNYIE